MTLDSGTPHPDGRFGGHVVLVTGSSSGIGAATARQFSAGGATVVINSATSVDTGRALAAELPAATYIQADVGDEAACIGLIDEVMASHGRLDVLVNNAGIAPEVRVDMLEANEASFDKLLATNLKGPYFLTQAAAGWMVELRRDSLIQRGCIVNIGSISATVASVNRADYCISKAGVAMATRLWAVRLAEYGIDCYEVRPGIIASDMTSGVRAKYDALIQNGLLLNGRWGTPDDVGRVVATLVRGDLPYSTGSVLTIDGGLTVPRM